MNIKPKNIFVNLPIALPFKDYHEISQFASTINTIIHREIKIKCEEIGCVNWQYIGIFYFQKNYEYQTLRNSFLHSDIKGLQEKEFYYELWLDE